MVAVISKRRFNEGSEGRASENTRAEEYRRRAAICEERAKAARNDEVRRTYEYLARELHKAAEQAEQTERAKKE